MPKQQGVDFNDDIAVENSPHQNPTGENPAPGNPAEKRTELTIEELGQNIQFLIKFFEDKLNKKPLSSETLNEIEKKLQDYLDTFEKMKPQQPVRGKMPKTEYIKLYILETGIINIKSLMESCRKEKERKKLHADEIRWRIEKTRRAIHGIFSTIEDNEKTKAQIHTEKAQLHVDRIIEVKRQEIRALEKHIDDLEWSLKKIDI